MTSADPTRAGEWAPDGHLLANTVKWLRERKRTRRRHRAETGLDRRARKGGVDRIVLYGSRAAGTARPDSDWDFVVILKPGMKSNTTDLAGLMIEMERILGADADDMVMCEADFAERFIENRVRTQRIVWNSDAGMTPYQEWGKETEAPQARG